MPLKILTDSACDLPKDLIDKYEIDILPLFVLYNDIEYLDGISIDPKKMYKDMIDGEVYKTSQINPDIFVEKFTEYAKNGIDCLYIAFSSGLSGTYQSSEIAKNLVLEDYPDFKVNIVDTKCASLGFGLVVEKTAKLMSENKSLEELTEAATFFANHMEHLFTVESLDYLCRGGRVSRTSAAIGGMLNIKPVLNVEDGKLIPLEKVRGRKKSFKKIVDLMEERGVDMKNQTIGISHGDDLKAVETIKGMITERLGCEDFLVSTIGCSIGAHSGPGTIAIFFLNELMS